MARATMQHTSRSCRTTPNHVDITLLCRIHSGNRHFLKQQRLFPRRGQAHSCNKPQNGHEADPCLSVLLPAGIRGLIARSSQTQYFHFATNRLLMREDNRTSARTIIPVAAEIASTDIKTLSNMVIPPPHSIGKESI